jgi:hypothetical protein
MAERQSFVDVGRMEMTWQREEFTFQDAIDYLYGFVENK